MRPFLIPLTKSRNELALRVSQYIVELGLSANELLVMWTALDAAKPSAAQIRRHLGMHPSTFSSLVQRLIDRGYVVTEPHPRDKRTRYLVLTIPGFMAVRIARRIQIDLEAAAQPFGGEELFDGLHRHGFLASVLPWPERTPDGLPAITA